MAAGAQAGLDSALVFASLPEAMADRMPALFALATAIASGSVAQVAVKAPPPRLRFRATMLYLDLLVMLQLMAAMMSVVQAEAPRNTSSAATFAPGATASTTPA